MTKQTLVVLVAALLLGTKGATADPLEPPPSFLAQWETPGDQETFGMAYGSPGAIFRADGHSGIEFRSPMGTILGGHLAYILAIDLGGWLNDVSVAPNGHVYAVGITLSSSVDRLWEWAPGQLNPLRASEVTGLPHLTSVAVLNDSTLLVAGNVGNVVECSLSGAVRGPWGLQSGNALDIAVSPLGDVFVSSQTDRKVFHYTSGGILLGAWGSLGSGEGQFSGGYQQVAADGLGNVYVADAGNDRVQKFRSDGTFVCQWGGPGGPTDSQLASPQGIATNPGGTIVAVSTNGQGGTRYVKVFQALATPTQQSSWGAVKVNAR